MNRIQRQWALLAVVFGGVILLVNPGCGSASRAYAPSTTSAREALDAALSSWSRGESAEVLATASPQVHIVDYQQRDKKVLESYEILAEQPGKGETEKRFSVRLQLKKPLGEQQAEFIIIGKGPIWVFRDADYAKTSDMGEDPKPKRRARR